MFRQPPDDERAIDPQEQFIQVQFDQLPLCEQSCPPLVQGALARLELVFTHGSNTAPTSYNQTFSLDISLVHVLKYDKI